MLSESEFTVKGHGVHTAYLEMKNALKQRKNIDIETNTKRAADIIHAQTIGFYVQRHLRKHGKAKKVISVHIIPESLIGSIKFAKFYLPIMKIYMKLFYNQADLLLACSGKVAKILKEELHVKPRVEILYNFVDMKKYRLKNGEREKARKKLKLSENDFVVIGNGQLQPRKRVDSFINVAKNLPEIKFIWLGGIPFKSLGDSSGKMEKMIKSAPENVHFTGIIPLEKVRNYLAAADVFFLPAEQENHPMSVLEAAGAGLPIILRDISEYNDTFRGDAIMGNDANFAKKIGKLHSDKAYYEKAKVGSARIAKRFDSVSGGRQLEDFYRELIEDKPK